VYIQTYKLQASGAAVSVPNLRFKGQLSVLLSGPVFFRGHGPRRRELLFVFASGTRDEQQAVQADVAQQISSRRFFGSRFGYWHWKQCSTCTIKLSPTTAVSEMSVHAPFDSFHNVEKIIVSLWKEIHEMRRYWVLL